MRRSIALILALVGVSASSALILPTVATADPVGDPAAIVLTSEPAFVPRDAGTSASAITQLLTVLRAANAHGLPLRVALIGSVDDLGSVTQDWGNPFAYARYLGAELSPTYRGPTLVVMPQGYALWVNGRATQAEQRALSDLTPPGGDLVSGALSVLRRLAAASGVAQGPGTAPVAAAPAPDPGRGGASSLPLVALIVGGLVILAAWVFSLRTRPLRARVPA